jgi:membrane-anchored mycosin MYCP
MSSTNAQPWVPNEFVVARPHLAVVMAELNGLPQPIHRHYEVSNFLDLVLVSIDNVEYAAQQINGAFGQGSRCDCRQAQPEHAIDRVIRAIRESCRRRYSGWVPLLGKNRTLDGVHTSQHVGIGGAAYPSCPDDVRIGDLSRGSSADRVTVGILDTGFWPHPQLKGRYLMGEPEVYLPAADRYPHTAGHSTFVAGIVLQNSPDVDLRIRSVIDAAGGTATAWDVANEMVQLARSVEVLNLSLACSTDDGEEPLVLARAIEFIGVDTIIVAAAGNHGGMTRRSDPRDPMSATAPIWPAASSRVVAVGAHDRNGERAPFSPEVPWMDLSAPGEDVDSLYLEGMVTFEARQGEPPQPDVRFDGFARWSGTSFAAAAATGAIARRIRPGTNPRQALREVLALTRGNPEGVWGYGLASGDGD